jgi:hypothetical protein
MYTFRGFFCPDAPGLRHAISSRWPDACVVSLSQPFCGLGVRYSDGHDVPQGHEQLLGSEPFAPLEALSAQFTELPIVYVVAECFGGACEYEGRVFRGGFAVAQESGRRALTRLVSHLDVRLDEREFFLPFTRSFPWERAA